MNVDGTGHGPDPLGNAGGECEIVSHVAADDLNVDRRGKTEIQGLGDDIGRLKEEPGGREQFWQLPAKLLDVPRSRMVFRVQRYQDLGIRIANRFTIAIRQIDSAGRQSDVVENAAELRC